MVSDQDPAPRVRVMFTASKRKHKRAVVRNLIKRRMREAYRLNKNRLPEYCPPDGELPKIEIAFSYVGQGEPLPFVQIEAAMIRLLDKLWEKTSVTPSEK